MSAGRSLGLQNRDRLRQWLPSQRGSNSPSNASVSSGNKGDYASSALPGPSSSSQLIEKGPKQSPKPRKRDRFLKFFERSPSDHPPKLKPFKRSTLERDLAVLSTTYLMEDCHSLKELILAIVALSAQCNDEKSSQLVGRCTEFCICLIQYFEENPASAVNAVDGFLRTINSIDSFDYNAEVSITIAEERVVRSITTIKASHPSLGDIKQGTSRGFSGTVVTVLDIGIPMITVLKDAAEVVGTVPFLKPVFAAVLVMFQAARQTQSNFDEMMSLSIATGEFALIIMERYSISRELPPNLDAALRQLDSRLHQIATRCQELSQKSFVTCFLRGASFKEELDGLKRSLDIAIQKFQTICLIDFHDEMRRIAENIEWGRLDGLPRHPDMSGKQAEYLVESRTPNVEEICNWIASSNELLLCVHGTAGVGKSTLAGHLSNELRVAGRLAGSIFLGAFPTDTSGPETIIKMLAHEIGSIHPRAIPRIMEAMQQCHGTSLEKHLQMYVLDPLQSLKHPQPLVVVIDALDEWRDHAAFIQALQYLNSSTSVLKFIATIRLNPVASCLPGIDKVSVRTYQLPPLSSEVIKAYFKKHLKSVPWTDGRMASAKDVDKLAELSGGLPVWAAVVISLLSHRFSELPPHELLAEIVGSRRQVGGSDGLRELYQNALKRLFTTPDIQKHFRRYLGATMVLQEPLSLSDFSILAGIPTHLAKNIRSALFALQTHPPPPGSEELIHPAARLFHLSFLEYVLATTTEDSFAISIFESHSVVALTCLKQLSNLLHSRQPQTFPLRALQLYAVKYWPLHIANGTPRSYDQWSQTEHCLALQMIPEAHKQWRVLFLESLMPENIDPTLEDVGEEDGMASTLKNLAHCLGKSGGDRWGFQVACLEVAIRIGGDAAEGWTELGTCYSSRGDRTGNLRMHEEAVMAFRHALDLRPEPHPHRGESLNKVAIALLSCYRQNGIADELNEAISCSRMALMLCPADHPARDRYLNTLANSLNDFYNHSGDLEILNEVISLHHEALALRPPPHPDRSDSLNNLANALSSMCKRNGDTGALDRAMSLHREALALRPAPHPDRSMSLNNLAATLQALHERDGDINKLNEAISLHHEALALRPSPHPDRFMSLNNLANALQTLHQCNGDTNVLTEAVSLHREALALRPAPYPDRASSLDNLAIALQSLYECDGDINALKEAISLHCEALSLRSLTHPDRPASLSNLANALTDLHERNGDLNKLNEAISLHQEALALRPPPHPERSSSLNNLASTLQSLYERNGDIGTLDKAISMHREALELRPAPRPDRSLSLNNLAKSLHSLYQHNKDIATLNECISLCRAGVELRPAPHPLRHTTLFTLAMALRSCFEHTGDVKVLDEAISLFDELPVLCPPGHRHRSVPVRFLVELLERRQELTGDDQDCGQIKDLKGELAGLDGEPGSGNE